MADFTMFGKTYNKVGNDTSNLCLNTKGDVIVKTPNRFISIFKNGKLNVDDTSEIFKVKSEDEMTKTGIYLLEKVNDKNENIQEVYLVFDNIKCLLTSKESSYISYTEIQNLKAENFLKALSNIGFYFKSLEEAKKANLVEGLVYILETQKLYKIIKGDFVEFEGTQEISKNVNINSPNSSNPSTSHSNVENLNTENLRALQIENIFINGANSTINSEKELSFLIGNIEYLVFKNNKITVKKDLVFDKQINIKTEGAQLGKNGFLLYKQNDETFLEVDNLILHNPTPSQEPQIYPMYLGTKYKNLILDASYDTPPDTLNLTLKYQNSFEEGDTILLHTTKSNKLTLEAKTVKVLNTSGVEQEAQKIYASLQEPPTELVRVNFDYSYSDDSTEHTEHTEIVIKPTIQNPETGQNEPNTVGESHLIETTSPIEFIKNVEISANDEGIYYGNEGGKLLPTHVTGTVISEEPLTIKIPSLNKESKTLLENLKMSVIYKYASASKKTYILQHNNENVSLLETYYENDTVKNNVIFKLGDLSNIRKPYFTTTAPVEFFKGHGLYVEQPIQIHPIFYSGTFEGIKGTEYPKYAKTLQIPEEDFDDEKYDDFIPSIAWVKKLIQKLKTAP